MIQRLPVLIYGVLAYGFGLLATLLYLIAFAGDYRMVPKTIDSGPPGDWPAALLIDVGLIALFGLQHSIMARPGFKRWWTRVIPRATERSTYLVATGVVLPLLFILWQPIPATVWDLRDSTIEPLLHTLYFGGWALAVGSSFMIHHGELFGLQQTFNHFRGRSSRELTFGTPLVYRFIRHPIYTGMVMAFWMAPHMTVGRLVFATGMTVYALIGATFEERDLVERFGEQYRAYRRRVGGFLPFLTRFRGEASPTPEAPPAGLDG